MPFLNGKPVFGTVRYAEAQNPSGSGTDMSFKRTSNRVDSLFAKAQTRRHGNECLAYSLRSGLLGKFTIGK